MIPVSDGIQCADHFDSGVTPSFVVHGDSITFDFRNITFPYIDCELQCSPRTLLIRLRLNPRGTLFYAQQGLYVSEDGRDFALHPLTKVGESTRTVETNGKSEQLVDTDFELKLAVGPKGRIRIATSDPYGRDHLEELVADTGGAAGHWRVFRRENRHVLLYEIGEDDGRKPVHYIIAGEDTRETEAQWVADRIIRRLAAGRPMDATLVKNAVIRICPVLSPYTSSTRGHNSYTSPVDGRDAYGSAKWIFDPSPPELQILKELMEATVQERRLGLALTLHSWWAGKPSTEIETIKHAGANTLAGARLDWAKKTMVTLMRDVPHASIALPERVWFPGLLREFMLARHNTITFRIEVTTLDQPAPRGVATAEALVTNLGRITDWQPAPETQP